MSLMSPDLAGGFFTTIITWEALANSTDIFFKSLKVNIVVIILEEFQAFANLILEHLEISWRQS